jgi:hypothetical protein
MLPCIKKQCSHKQVIHADDPLHRPTLSPTRRAGHPSLVSISTLGATLTFYYTFVAMLYPCFPFLLPPFLHAHLSIVLVCTVIYHFLPMESVQFCAMGSCNALGMNILSK